VVAETEYYKTRNENPKVPSTVKSEVADVALQMCAKDVMPFSMIDGTSFKAMAEKLICTGAKYGILGD